MPSVALALGKRVVVVITRAVFGISSKKRRQSVVLPHPDGPVNTNNRRFMIEKIGVLRIGGHPKAMRDKDFGCV